MKGVFFENRRNYDLRSDNHLQLPKLTTTRYGTENIMYRGYLLRSSLQKEIKSSGTLSEFKERIKLWNGNTCNCTLCTTFIPGVGYLQIKKIVVFVIKFYLSCNNISFLYLLKWVGFN